MKPIHKKSGFTLLELLVVIVIISILSAISVSKFRESLVKGRDSERSAAVQNLAVMIKMDAGSTWDCGTYNYLDDTEKYEGAKADLGNAAGTCEKNKNLQELFAESDYVLADPKMDFKYYYGFLLGEREGANDFFVMAFAEQKNPQNAKNLENETMVVGSVTIGYAFLEGTKKGIDEAIACSAIGTNGSTKGKLKIDPTFGSIDCSTKWYIRKIMSDGTLEAQ